MEGYATCSREMSDLLKQPCAKGEGLPIMQVIWFENFLLLFQSIDGGKEIILGSASVLMLSWQEKVALERLNFFLKEKLLKNFPRSSGKVSRMEFCIMTANSMMQD